MYSPDNDARSPATPIVFIVDDDISVRESLEPLIRHEGWQPETFATAEAFLARPQVPVPSPSYSSHSRDSQMGMVQTSGIA
jgi:hypothetical protein